MGLHSIRHSDYMIRHRPEGLRWVHMWCLGFKGSGVHMPREASDNPRLRFDNDPSAGSPTETLLRLLLPLNDQV